MMVASKRALDFGGSFGLGGGEGITGPPADRPKGLIGEESWTSWVATTRGIGR